MIFGNFATGKNNNSAQKIVIPSKLYFHSTKDCHRTGQSLKRKDPSERFYQDRHCQLQLQHNQHK